MNPGAPDIKALFAEALQRAPGPDRDAYLDAACAGDPGLRARLVDLLAAHGQAIAILGPAGAPAAADSTLTFARGRSPFDPTDAEPTVASGPVPAAPPLDPTEADGTTPDPDSHPAALPRGTAVRYLGDYEIRRELGRGGMGVVYEARQMSLNRPVALKLVQAGPLAGTADLRRFRNEAEAVALLDHPNIVPIYEVGEHEGQHYFSMKLVPGGSLVPLLGRYPADPKAAARLVAEAAEAVAHAHARGVLHRDLKPDNILVDADGHPYLTDFGIARRLADDSDLTRTGVPLGTPKYMAPEQADNRRGSITTATDVYGLGAVLYALLTGRPPFTGDHLADILAKVRTEPPVPPRKLNPSIPPDLETICLKCLEKDPRRRYATADDLAADLRAWLDRRPIAARPARALERALLFVRRKPLLASTYALAATVLLLAGVGGTMVWLWREAENARARAVAAQEGEKQQRLAAEQAGRLAVAAREGEKTQRLAAEQAGQRAEAARKRLEIVEYGRAMQIAYQEWRDNDVGVALGLLERTSPHLRGWEWSYLHRLCNASLLTLKGHSGWVTSASFSPDGSRIVTSSGSVVRIWDAATGAEVRARRWLWGFISSAAFSPDGLRIVMAGPDELARVWDADGTGLLVLKAPKNEGLELEPRDSTTGASFSADGRRILTTGFRNPGLDGLVRVWDATTGALLQTIQGGKRLGSASFSPDASCIVIADEDGTARVIELANGAERLVLRGHEGAVLSVAFSRDGTRIVTAGVDSTVRIWDATTGAEVRALRGHRGQVSSAAFSPDGTRIVTAGIDRSARIWDAATGSEQLIFRGHTELVRTAAFSPDGARVVTCSDDRTARIWDATRNADALKLGDSLTNDGAFSADGKRILTIGMDGKAGVWDAATGVKSYEIQGHVEPLPLFGAQVTCGAFSPDGTRIVTAGSDNTLRLWDASTGAARRVLGKFGTNEGWATCVVFDADGDRVLTGTQFGYVKIWDAGTGAELVKFDRERRSVKSAAFRSDGSLAAVAYDNGLVKIRDAATGALHRDLVGHKDWVESVAFSRDGLRLLTASFDGTARLWNVADGKPILEMTWRGERMRSAAFSPDESRIVTTSQGGDVQIREATTGAELLVLGWEDAGAWFASFSPDGTRLLTGNPNGAIEIRDSRPFQDRDRPPHAPIDPPPSAPRS
jgi:WD40 repeat protein